MDAAAPAMPAALPTSLSHGKITLTQKIIELLVAYFEAFVSRRRPEVELIGESGESPPSYKKAKPEDWLLAEHLIVRAPASLAALCLHSHPCAAATLRICSSGSRAVRPWPRT